jgi:hypothetical protein
VGDTRRAGSLTLRDMNKRLSPALAAYLAVWAVVAGGIIYGSAQAGYSAWLGVGAAFLLFVFVNGSLAYRARARQLRLEGKEPPSYFRYLCFPQGSPKWKEEAPRFEHLLVGIAAALTGMFFVFCGVALALDADWSRITQPLLVVAVCTVVASIGIAFLYLAWRLLAFGRGSRANVA